jgi:hypothetical protein
MAYEIEDALALITDLLKLAEDVGDAALAKHTDLAGLAAMFLARAGQSVFSAGLLAQHGLNGDALSVGRTVTEMAIDYRFIALDPAARIKRFSDYDHVAKYKVAKATDKLHGGTEDDQRPSAGTLTALTGRVRTPAVSAYSPSKQPREPRSHACLSFVCS